MSPHKSPRSISIFIEFIIYSFFQISEVFTPIASAWSGLRFYPRRNIYEKRSRKGSSRSFCGRKH
jgi:hypothetical protein